MTPMMAQLEFDWSQWSAPFTRQWGDETGCSVLVGIACGVLGCFVVLRRMALIGDALSHAVLPGVVIAFLLTGSTGVTGLFLGALLAGLITAVLIKLVSQHSRTKEDSAIGIVFTAFFAVGIILLSSLSRGTHFDMQCFLFGDPLAVQKPDIIMMAVVAPLVVLIVILFYHPLKLASFDPVVATTMGISVSALHYLLMGMLSATVVAGLKATGVILVVAMVITPASAAYQLANRLWLMLLLAGGFGAVSAAAGMSLAFVTNSPTGPAMVLVATILFGAAVVLSPNHGWLLRAMRKRSLRRHIDGEDVLKALEHLRGSGVVSTIGAVIGRTGFSARRLGSAIRELGRGGFVRRTGDVVALSGEGQRRATGLVRAHRLWESYLADEAHLGMENIHEVAERLEHAHELADALAAQLGNPLHDPHGEPIPDSK